MYASLAQTLDFQMLPVDTEVVIPSGTALYVASELEDVDVDVDSRLLRRVVAQDTFTIPLTEPVDVVFAEELEEEEKVVTSPSSTPIQLIAPVTAKADDDTPWYRPRRSSAG